MVDDGRAPTDAALEALTMMLPRYRSAEFVLELGEAELALDRKGRVVRRYQRPHRSHPLMTHDEVGL